MKRLLTLAVVLIMLLALAACQSTHTATADPTDAPATEAPEEATAEPTEEPTAEPTEEPAEPTDDPLENAVHFGEGNFTPLDLDIPMLVDLDGDGADDTVLIQKDELRRNEDYVEYYVSVTITLASMPDEPFETRIERCYDGAAAVVDCDPDDARREVIFSYDMESNDYVTYAWRVNAEGSAVDTFTAGMMFGVDNYFYDGFPEGYTFDPEEGLPCEKRTEILGTFYVEGRFTVTEEGIEDITEMYAYPEIIHDEFIIGRLTLERELTLTNLDDDLNELEEVTLPVGTVLFQKYTDCESWVIVEGEDGTLYKASVRIVETDDEWGIYINDINQDELAVIAYAD